MAVPSDYGNLIVWLKASTGCYQDAGMVTPCTDGTTVYTWVNQGTGGFNFIQPTAGSRPTWRTGGAGDKPYLQFNSDFLGSVSGPYAQPITMFFAYKFTSRGGNPGVLTASNLAGGCQVTWYSSNQPYIWAGSSVIYSSLPSNTSPAIYVARHNGTSSFFRQNTVYGVTSPSADIGSNTLLNIHLCADQSTTYPVNGDLYEVAMYNSAMSLSDIQALENYFAAQYLFFVNDDTEGLPTNDERPVKYAIQGIDTGLGGLTVGVRREDVEGNPAPPCLAIDIPGHHRFRWGVLAGTRTISIDTKQVSNVTGKRPRIIVKANPEIGVNADVVGDAGAGTGWTTIGPLTVTPTSDGVLWVELWNMDTQTFESPAYFDHLVRT